MSNAAHLTSLYSTNLSANNYCMRFQPGGNSPKQTSKINLTTLKSQIFPEKCSNHLATSEIRVFPQIQIFQVKSEVKSQVKSQMFRKK